MDAIVDASVPAILVFFIIVAIGHFVGYRLRWALLFMLYMVGYGIILSYPPTIQQKWYLQLNWIGKVLAIVYSLVVIRLLRLTRNEVGFQWPGLRWRTTLAGILATVVFGIVVNFMFRDGKWPTVETLLYQASMPGLDEELAFRGIGFAMLVRSFAARGGVWWATGLTATLFGLGHALNFAKGNFHFSAVAFMYTGTMGLLLGVTRAKTGSLLGPVIAHNVANVCSEMVSSLQPH
jgi:membrane protease YdiL (CAAX protease family)